MPKAKFSRESLREAAALYGYLRPYRGKFLAATAALLVSSVCSLAFPFVTGRLLDGALGAAAGTASAGWSLNQLTLGLLAALSLQAFFSFCQSIWFVEVGERVLVALRRDTFAHIIQMPMRFFAERRVGELTSRLSADLTQIQETLTWTVSALLRQATTLAGGLALITWTSPRLTLVMVASLPVVVGFAVWFGRQIRRLSRQAQDTLADTQTIVEESLQGIANVKAFANEGYEVGRYRASLEHFLQTVLSAAKYRGGFFAFIIFGLFGTIVVVMRVGAGMVQSGEMSVGQLTSFMLYTTFVGAAMAGVAEMYSQLQKALGATERVREMLRASGEAVSLDAPPAGPRLKGEVVFDRVSFAYPSRPEVRVLHEVSLTIRSGQRVALVGPSGAGKSTIASLLLRFYEPQSGEIRLDGRPASSRTLTEVRRQLSIVPQDVLLFGGTIRENIAYGRPSASAAEVEAAARQANAHEFIERFPEGYGTVVGERGMKLSGGQRQRVAIARALLKDPAILILDEATSSLDAQSERWVQEALETLMRGRTSLIIAHRLSTVRSADAIVVVKEGTVVETGTHDQLMAVSNGLYRTLSTLQLH